MAIKIRGERQSHRFHEMDLLSSDGAGGKSGDIALNIVPLVDMMMVLVIFLVMNFDATGELNFKSENMEMPKAEHVGDVEIAPIIAITYNKDTGSMELFKDGQLLVDMATVNKEDADMNIPELEESLKADAEFKEGVASIQGGDAGAVINEVIIQVHKEVDYSIIKRVLHTCSVAGYSKVNFAVNDGRGGSSGGEGAEE